MTCSGAFATDSWWLDHCECCKSVFCGTHRKGKNIILELKDSIAIAHHKQQCNIYICRLSAYGLFTHLSLFFFCLHTFWCVYLYLGSDQCSASPRCSNEWYDTRCLKQELKRHLEDPNWTKLSSSRSGWSKKGAPYWDRTAKGWGSGSNSKEESTGRRGGSGHLKLTTQEAVKAAKEEWTSYW